MRASVYLKLYTLLVRLVFFFWERWERSGSKSDIELVELQNYEGESTGSLFLFRDADGVFSWTMGLTQLSVGGELGGVMGRVCNLNNVEVYDVVPMLNDFSEWLSTRMYQYRMARGWISTRTI